MCAPPPALKELAAVTARRDNISEPARLCEVSCSLHEANLSLHLVFEPSRAVQHAAILCVERDVYMRSRVLRHARVVAVQRLRRFESRCAGAVVRAQNVSVHTNGSACMRARPSMCVRACMRAR
eukprot:538378-Pleurochrysis_carterae.AAC.1